MVKQCCWCGRIIKDDNCLEQGVFDFAVGTEEDDDGKVVCLDCANKEKLVKNETDNKD